MFDVPLEFIRDITTIKRIHKKVNGDMLTITRLAEKTSLNPSQVSTLLVRPEPFIDFWMDIKTIIFNAHKLKVLASN
jgi:hypothetical protein